MKNQDRKIVPFVLKPSGRLVPTEWRSIALKTGGLVQVGLQGKRSKQKIVCKFYQNQKDGTRTELIVPLSHAACLALVALFYQHGIMKGEWLNKASKKIVVFKEQQ